MFGDLITADHQILRKKVNPEPITDILWWCKTWLPNGFKLIRAKQKLRRKLKELTKVLGADQETKSHLH